MKILTTPLTMGKMDGMGDKHNVLETKYYARNKKQTKKKTFLDPKISFLFFKLVGNSKISNLKSCKGFGKFGDV